MKNTSLLQRITEKERQYVLEVLDTDFRSSKGSLMMTRLEQAFAKKYGVKYAISHVNGTSTLHSAVAAAGVGPGNEVIVPPLTMSSTTFAILQNNAVPVFCDVDEETFNLDPAKLEACITDKTKAIMPVSLYGLPCDSKAINAIAKKHGLIVIEDNAECFGGKVDGAYAGTQSPMASYSFQSSKHLTSGEGGMVITNDEALAVHLRRFSCLGYAGVGAGKGKITREEIQDPEYNRHCAMGWNYRMPELCSAVALAQLEHADELVTRRQDVAALFQSKMEHCGWLRPQKSPAGFENSYWTLAVQLDTEHVDWHKFRDTFKVNGGDGIYAAWQLTYLEPMFQQMELEGRDIFFQEPFNHIDKNIYRKGLCPVAEHLQPRMLQFKTNYWDWEKAEQQAEVLEKTIRQLE